MAKCLKILENEGNVKNVYEIIKKKKLEKQLRKREIEIEEYFEKIDEQGLDSFPQVLFEFKAQTGFQIVLASKYQIRAWSELQAH